MVRNRIARTVALATFGLVALGGIALAAPGNADTGGSGRSSTSDSDGASGTSSPSGAGSGSAPADPGSASGGAPATKLGSDPTVGISPGVKSELAGQLADLDAQVKDVVDLKDQIDNDPNAEPEAVGLADADAAELVREQQVAHDVADQQGIPAQPTAQTTSSSVSRAAGVNLQGQSVDTIMMQVNMDRANMLDAQVRQQAAIVKAQDDKLVALKTKLASGDLSPAERAAIITEIDQLTSSNQLQMTQLQALMNKFNQTTEALSNWLSKDAQSKNTIAGNQR